MAFCDSFISFTIMSSRFIHVVAYIISFFFFTAVSYSILLIHHILFIIHQLTFELFPFGALKNNAIKSIYIQIFAWIYAVISLGYTHISEMSRSYSSSVFKHFQELPNNFSEMSSPVYNSNGYALAF